MRACFILFAVFCVRTEDLFVGVQSFSSRVFSASGMASAWRPWTPHRGQASEPAMGGVTDSETAATDAMENDETGSGTNSGAHLSAPAPGGAAARHLGMPVDPPASATALPGGRPSPLLPTPPAAGDCDRCNEALMSFEKGWNTQLCNRCFNKSQRYDTCKKCGKGLWTCERNTGLGLCLGCHQYGCKHCQTELEVDELRYAKQCCNRCYNLRKGSTEPCLSCRRGLLLREQAKSGWCGRCWQEWRPGGDL